MDGMTQFFTTTSEKKKKNWLEILKIESMQILYHKQEPIREGGKINSYWNTGIPVKTNM